MNMNVKKLSRQLAILSGVVILLVSMFMIVNYVQIKTHNPIEGNAVDELVKKLESTDDEEALRTQIRVVDLLARKAYFSYLWQIETGAWIILGFLVILLVSVKVYFSQAKIDGAPKAPSDHFWSERSKERKWMMIGVGSLAVAALIVALNSGQYYSDFRMVQADKATESTQVSETSEPTTELTAAIETDSADILESKVDSIIDFPTDAEIKRNHPGFRGPYGLGVNYKTSLPVDWDGATGKNILWSKPLSLPGLNSPILWDNYLFIAGANASSRKVFCYNRLTGALLWGKEIKNVPGSPASAPKVTNDTGHSASGLTTDGRNVYAIFSTGDIIALNFKGEQQWARNLGVPDNHYGHSSSLLIYKDKLIVQYDDNKACRLMALSTLTGETVWNTRREGEISWSSPILVPKGSSAEIIVNNLPYVASYNADSGKENWKLSCLTGEIGPSPAYGNGMVFVANEYARMLGIKDGKIVWENYDYLPDVSSPVAYKDIVFFTTSYGDLVCVNQKDGAILWTHEFDVGFYGSPVIADGKLYCVDRSGTTIIVEAAREFKLVGQPSIGEKSDCTPAFANGMIYIRGVNKLYCIGKK